MASRSKCHIAAEADARFRADPYYKYEPLDNGWIRLIRIEDLVDGGDISDLEPELQFLFFTFPVNSCPEYDALSYTWSEPVERVQGPNDVFTKVERVYTMSSNGRVVRGTRNLRDALRRLRQCQCLKAQHIAELPQNDKEISKRYGKTRFYWVDAVCINQDDPAERAVQVQIMGQIFRNAQGTIIWLGESDAHARTALAIMSKMHEAMFQRKVSTNASISLLRKTYGDLTWLEGDEATALYHFFKRTWFQRLWILQELILSATALALCGGLITDFRMISYGGFRISQQLGSEYLTSHGKGRANARIEGSAVTLREDGPQQLPMRKFDDILRCRDAVAKNTLPDFMTAMTMCLGSRSSDSHDRIYAVLGLVAEFSPSNAITIVPDYNIPVCELYTDATRIVIEKRQDLLPLILCCDVSDVRIEFLPSWCPDYSSHDSAATSLKTFNDASRRWQLGKLWAYSPIVDMNTDKTILVSGFSYDVIEGVAHLGTANLDDVGGGVSSLFEMAFGADIAVAEQARDHRGAPVSSQMEDMWRLMILDEFRGESPAPQVAGLFFPATVWTLLSMTSSFLSGDARLEDEKVFSKHRDRMQQELSRLENIFDKIIRLDPRNAVLLPNITGIKTFVSGLSPTTINKKDWFYDYVTKTLKEIAMMTLRAAHVGLAAELRHYISQQSVNSPEQLDVDKLATIHYNTSLKRLNNHHFTKRAFFKTRRNHHLGAGHRSVRPGDEVWLLNGAPSPFILRPKPNGKFQFMGEAYVQGIMLGEARHQNAISGGQDRTICIE